MEQQVRFCKTSDSVRIAYASVGSGSPLVKAANWLNHLEFDWKSPLWRPLLEDLAQDFSLVRYDERGNGLSDWNVADLSFESFVSDLEAVIDAAGLKRFALLGISQGGPVSIAYAVKHPERVSHLILYGAYPCGWKVRANPEEVRLREAMLELVHQGWGKENPAFRQIWTSFYIPDGTPEQMQWFNELQRVTTSPENAIRLLSEFGKIDVRPLLSQVTVPTLVLHCQGDAAVPLESGRLIAAGIPGARFVTLPGKNHVPLPQDEAWHLMSAEIRRFLGVPERPVTAWRAGAESAAPQISPGAMVNQYRVGPRLGAGGMGEVFRARDTRLERDVALKVLRVPAEEGTSARRRLLAEARAAAALAHPNICVVYEAGESREHLYIAMELVPGEPLANAAGREAMTTSRVVQIGMQLADALDHAHSKGVVHRDLKPGNVVITPEGRAKILDFGLAVRTSAEWADATKSSASLADSRAIAGTLPYMPPEVLRGQPADARSDIWSLGVLLFELLVGRLPFRGDTGFDLSSAILRDPVPPLPPAVPPGLAAVIRRCLEKDPGQRYQRAGEIRAALETISAQPVSVPETAPAPVLPAAEKTLEPGRFFARRGIVVAVGLAILLIILALLPGVRKKIFGGGSTAPKIESLAVLPLDNMTGDPAQEYFADGITESLITELAQLSGLKKVTSRTSVMQFKKKGKSMPEIAKLLGVDAIIEGSVQRAGDRVGITVQLIDPVADKHLWAKSYERDLRDILALQREVARAIAAEIRVQLTPLEQSRLTAAQPVNRAAHDAYLQGRFYMEKRTPESLRKAVGSLQEAIRIDPRSAPAYAALSRAYAEQGIWGGTGISASQKETLDAALKAVHLDPNLAEAQYALAAARTDVDWDWVSAEAAYQRAFQLNPNFPEALHTYAYFLQSLGRHEDAIVAIRRAVELAPTVVAFVDSEGRILYRARRYEDAIARYKRALEMDPDYPPPYQRLVDAYVMTGKYADALSVLEKGSRLFPDSINWQGRRAFLYARMGRRQEAMDLLGQLEKARGDNPPAYELASAYVALGNRDRAMFFLELGFRKKLLLPIFLRDPKFDPLHDDPRFKMLLRRMNLPE